MDKNELKKIWDKASNSVYHGEWRAQDKSKRIIERTVKRKKFLKDFIRFLFDRLMEPHHECFYCGKKLATYEECSFDHYHTLRGVRTHRPENIVICCLSCNNTKRDLSVEEFMREYPYKTRALRERMG